MHLHEDFVLMKNLSLFIFQPYQKIFYFFYYTFEIWENKYYQFQILMYFNYTTHTNTNMFLPKNKVKSTSPPLNE